MNKKFLNYALLLLFSTGLLMTSCSDDDDDKTTDNTISYELNEINDSDVSGSIVFTELENGSIQAEIDLDGTTDGVLHPAHIHMNSAAFGGDILVSLEPVAGATGSSVTIFNTDDNGNSIQFNQIDNLNAYVNIHKSVSELEVIYAQADIGSNVLTGEEKSYDLAERDVDGISGSVTFSKRKNGYTLATIELENTPDGGSHPAHIHKNSAAEGGDILISFTPVDGSTGMSMTDIRETDDGMALDYEDILTVNGYVNVHLSADELSTIVAQGDIGSNELTGESIDYELETRDVAGISGMITFEERLDGSILATIDLEGTPNGGSHPAHIHENSAAEGGPILVSFNPVDGTSGISKTTIRMQDDGSPITYQAINTLNGYVNVHLSAEELSTIVAQGDIGINVD